MGVEDLDDALSSTLVVTDSAFGADVGVGTVGMNSVTESGDFSAYTGWRLFDNTADFGWLKGDVVSGLYRMLRDGSKSVSLMRFCFPREISRTGESPSAVSLPSGTTTGTRFPINHFHKQIRKQSRARFSLDHRP